MRYKWLIISVLLTVAIPQLCVLWGFGESFSTNDASSGVKNEEKNKEATPKYDYPEFQTRVIVVTADRVGKKDTDIALPVSVVGQDVIEQNMFTSLIDLLGKTPGFTHIWEYHSLMLLRGMNADRMIILKDGDRRMGTMPKGLRGQNVNVYGIERVEVIRGPGSVIYGSGATCGIINMISRDIFKDKGVNVRVGGVYGSNNSERVGLSRFHWNSGELAMQISGRYRKADNYHFGGGEEAENSFIEDKDISAGVGYRLNSGNRVMLSTDLHYGGPWGKPEGYNGKLMRINNESDNTYHSSLKYEGDSVSVFNKLLVSVYYDYETREFHKRKLSDTGGVTKHAIVNYKDKYGGGHLLGVVHLGSHSISVGGDGYIFRLWSPGKEIDYGSQNPLWKDTEGVRNTGISSIGSFIQDNWNASRMFTLIAGVRYDLAKVVEGDITPEKKVILGETASSSTRDAVSGNMGVVCHTGRRSSVNLNIGRAFRMPAPHEMFGEKVSGMGVMLGNPKLQPEYSWNLDMGYKGVCKGLEWDIALFSNFYEELIYWEDYNESDEIDKLAVNKGRVRIAGFEVQLSYLIKDIFVRGHHVKPGGSFSYYRGDEWSGNGSFWNLHKSEEPLSGMSPGITRCFLRYITAMEHLSYFLEFDLYYSMKKDRLPEQGDEDTDSFALYGITTGIRVFGVSGLDSIKFNISVQNLLDEKYYPFMSSIPGKGRNVKMFLSAEY